jgi:hypothetical protein
METLKWYGIDLAELTNGDYAQMGWRWTADKKTREYLVSGIIEGVKFLEEFISDDTQINKMAAHKLFWEKESELLKEEK